eukprot:GHVT01028204.1.p1 GENE.GHVT01028204.1~~GHVT01028204.1.p1  ORF type:complete len:136 (-),score=39.98 GHVT01028204.1:803-1210(-)
MKAAPTSIRPGQAGAKGGKPGKAKPTKVKFTIEAGVPVEDKVLEVADLSQFLKQRIKVEGRVGNLGERVAVSTEKNRIQIAAELPFSKRYLKYLTKKYLKKQQLRDFLRVVATKENAYELRYFKTGQVAEGGEEE